ncbi:MAG: hypothetical protein R3E39_07180 [Anaerolineae bacterium]
MTNLHFRVLFSYLLLAFLIWLLVMFEFRLDDSFITYRYARNLADGLGLVYNPGDQILSTTAPLYAIALAALSFVIRDFHALGGLISTISIGLGAWFVYKLLPEYMPFVVRYWAGIVYLTSSLLWLSLGMETSIWIMMVLGAFYASQVEKWKLAGLLIGLSVLTRADAAIAGGIIGISAFLTALNRISTRANWRKSIYEFALASIIPILLFLIYAAVFYGSPLPATLSAKSAQAVLGISGLGLNVDMLGGVKLILRSLMDQSSLYIVIALLILFGVAGRSSNIVKQIVFWGGLHLLAYAMLRVAPYRWYYAPLIPGAILLAASGLYFLQQRMSMRGFRHSFAVVVLISIFPLVAHVSSILKIKQYLTAGGPPNAMLPVIDWKAYHDTGEWLAENTSIDATVGVAEVGQLGFFARRWMTDYLGLLQPDVSAMLRRSDLYSWLVAYVPDYLVFQRFRGAGLVLYNLYIENDPWFRANYHPTINFDDARYYAGPVTVFERIAAKSQTVDEQSADVDFEIYI